MLGFKLSYDNLTSGSLENRCLPSCVQTDYIQEVSSSMIDSVAIDNYNAMSQTDILGDPRYALVFQALNDKIYGRCYKTLLRRESGKSA